MKKKKLLFISLFIIIAFIAACSTEDKVAVRDVDLSKIPDGSYKGSYKFAKNDRSVYHVVTTVKNHKIINIDLQFDQRINTRFTTMAKAVFNRIIEKQTPNVDVVTGATKTSKEYMKSVENSLLQADK
jgi:uncharacterized protein with FMN-binding domain